jgi:hypothetical protein
VTTVFGLIVAVLDVIGLVIIGVPLYLTWGSVLPPRWRVHDRGRVTHLILDGSAACGEPGTNWRVVAGMSRCPACGPANADLQVQPAA